MNSSSASNPVLNQPLVSPENVGDDLTSARKVLEIESNALHNLSINLDKNFTQAIDILSEIKGRSIVTGMGKSGHIANKIAATLASTGTPSFFVHPGEASHGDLGMITKDDAVLALSNSGETSELADLIAYCKRFNVPLISMTSRKNSTLDVASTISFILPNAPEACPMGLAPTTSTTLMLGLGDAIAVALLERKNFSPTDFQTFHPGGKLGLKLLKVCDLMHSGDELPTADGDLSMSEAILIISEKRFGCLAVVDKYNHLQGIITDGDLRRHMDPNFLAKKAKDLMTVGAQTVGPNALASEAVAIMDNKSITNLFVIENQRCVGIIHIHDCLRAGIF
jgi:arabinose-5-phosphate isomerase